MCIIMHAPCCVQSSITVRCTYPGTYSTSETVVYVPYTTVQESIRQSVLYSCYMHNIISCRSFLIQKVLDRVTSHTERDSVKLLVTRNLSLRRVQGCMFRIESTFWIFFSSPPFQALDWSYRSPISMIH